MLPRAPLPDAFVEWQCAARHRLFEQLATAGALAARMNPAHLPVLATRGAGPVGVNLACKGVGLLPRPDLLAEFTRQFERARTEATGRPNELTLAERARAAAGLYASPANLNPWTLGGLEIFEGQTAQNLRLNPLAALIFVGEAPRFASYQIDGSVELLAPESALYRFLRAARELFATDAFHLPQSRYPFGYLFHSSAVLDKTPHSLA
jgi:hypothetical protein